MHDSQDKVRIEYIPPATEQVEAYSQQVCRDLGDEFAEPEVVLGFTQFVKVIIGIAARHLNGEGFDNERQ
jgi:hypothetical protein